MPEWRPREIRRFIEARDTGSQTIHIATDEGEGFLKGASAHVSPHTVACEWVGTALAALLGLRVFEHAIVEVKPDDDLPTARGGLIAPGPAFVARKEAGLEWSGDGAALKRLSNPDHVALLVAFDTWTLNCDRHAPHTGRRPHPDNVFLSRKDGAAKQRTLVAMDQGHCFTCGREITRRIAEIGHVQDDRLYGLFPAFKPLLELETLRAAAAALATVDPAAVRRIFDALPAEWRVGDDARAAWLDFVLRRAEWLAARFVFRVTLEISGQGELGL